MRKRAAIRERDTLPRLAWSIEEAAEALSIGRSQLYYMVHSGQIRTIRAGRRILIPADAMQEYLKGEANGAA